MLNNFYKIWIMITTILLEKMLLQIYYKLQKMKLSKTIYNSIRNLLKSIMMKRNKINIKKQLKSKKIYHISKEFKNNHYK